MNVAVIGAGNMGSAIVRGLYAAREFKITVANPSSGKLDALKADCKDIETTNDNKKAVGGADFIILAVKPYMVPKVIEEIKGLLDYDHQVIVSLAASLSLNELAALASRQGIAPEIFIAIPDTAIAVRKGLTFITTNSINQTSIERVKSIFLTLGDADVVSENLLRAGTALSSCGIAYAFKYVQACVQAGVQLGFKPADALRYTIETVAGAMEILKVNNSLPQQEIDRVTTPGGMTIKGVNELDHCGFTSAVINAIMKPLEK